jgi:hypothetical protein
MVKFQVMDTFPGKFTCKDGNFPSKDENFPRIMANMVKFNELYQVTAVKSLRQWLGGSNPAESFKYKH